MRCEGNNYLRVGLFSSVNDTIPVGLCIPQEKRFNWLLFVDFGRRTVMVAFDGRNWVNCDTGNTRLQDYITTHVVGIVCGNRAGGLVRSYWSHKATQQRWVGLGCQRTASDFEAAVGERLVYGWHGTRQLVSPYDGHPLDKVCTDLDSASANQI